MLSLVAVSPEHIVLSVWLTCARACGRSYIMHCCWGIFGDDLLSWKGKCDDVEKTKYIHSGLYKRTHTQRCFWYNTGWRFTCIKRGNCRLKSFQCVFEGWERMTWVRWRNNGIAGLKKSWNPKCNFPQSSTEVKHMYFVRFFLGDILTQVELAGSWVAFCSSKNVFYWTLNHNIFMIEMAWITSPYTIIWWWYGWQGKRRNAASCHCLFSAQAMHRPSTFAQPAGEMHRFIETLLASQLTCAETSNRCCLHRRRILFSSFEWRYAHIICFLQLWWFGKTMHMFWRMHMFCASRPGVASLKAEAAAAAFVSRCDHVRSIFCLLALWPPG